MNYDYRLAARESAMTGAAEVNQLIAKYTNTVEDTEVLHSDCRGMLLNHILGLGAIPIQHYSFEPLLLLASPDSHVRQPDLFVHVS